MSADRHGVVLLAGPDAEGALVQAIDARDRQMVVVRRCADLAEVRAAGRAGVADLAVVDASDPDLDAAAIGDLHLSGMSVVLLAPPEESRRLLSLGADAVAQAASPDGVVESLIALVRDRGEAGPPAPAPASSPPERLPPEPGAEVPPPAPSRGRVIAVWGTSGSPGRTTVAVNVAAALACRRTDTLLIDADTAAPSLAHLLGLPVDAPGIGVLARQTSRGRLDPRDIGRIGVGVAPGLSVVTGLSAPQRWRELGPVSATEVLRSARRSADAVVVDVAASGLDPVETTLRHQGSRDEVVAAVLREADTVLAVARGDAVGLSRLAQSLEWWRDLRAEADLRIVVNRVSRASAGPRPVNAIAAALSDLVPGGSASLVPEDEHVASALLGARPVVAGAPGSPAGAALAELAGLLMGEAPEPHGRHGRAGAAPRRRRRRGHVGD
jgi:MinD-like ATPase involved in chromosome partitioning or flagellar assembly